MGEEGEEQGQAHGPGDLLLPVVEGGGRGDDQERAPDPVGLGQVGQEGQGLDCLAQPHIICQYPIDALVIQRTQPIHAF